MKRTKFFSAFFAICLVFLWGSTLSAVVTIPAINDKAPAFTAQTTKGKICFPKDFTGKWVILLSHPADFTPVCKTEFKRLAKLVDELKQLNTDIIGLSVDSNYTHDLWIQDVEKEMLQENPNQTIRKIDFPVIADENMKVSKKYGLIHPKEHKDQTVRAVYIINPEGKIRAILFYPMAVGRSFNEVKRLLQALQITEKEEVATPSDWQQGQSTISKKELMKDVLPKEEEELIKKTKAAKAITGKSAKNLISGSSN